MWLWRALTGLLVLASAGAADDAAPVRWQSVLYREPYLQAASHEAVTVVFQTLGDVDPVLRYGASIEDLAAQAPAGSVAVRRDLTAHARGGSAPDGVVQYEIRLTGLRPATRYYYAVYDGDRRLAGGDETHCFTTHPRIGEDAPLRFVAFGDSGVGSWAQMGIRDAVQRVLAAEKRPADLWLGLGDLAQGDGDETEYHYTVARPYADDLRRVVLWPSPGNHDIFQVDEEDGSTSGPYCDFFVVPTRGESGGAPSGTEAYYSFDYGRVHIVSLNTYQVDRSAEGPMAQWLRRDLELARQRGRTDWLVAFFHAPLAQSSLGLTVQSVEVRRYLLPILEQGGVDLILGGHVHNYQRSVLLDGAYASPSDPKKVVVDSGDGGPELAAAYRKPAGLQPHQGAVQIVAGTGGGGTFLETAGPFVKQAFARYGWFVCDIEGDTLTGRFIDRDGLERDRFFIVKRGEAAPRAAAGGAALRPPHVLRRRLAGVRFAQIPLIEERPMLDGVFDEPVWQRAVKGRLTAYHGVLLLAHADGLCLAFHWGNARPRVVATSRDDDLSSDSGFDVRIDANYDRATFYRFAFNSRGVQHDSRDWDTAFDADWSVKTQPYSDRHGTAGELLDLKFGRRHGESWSAEALIPWQAIGLSGPPAEDRGIGMNVYQHPPGWAAFWFYKRGRYDQETPPPLYGTVRVGRGRAVTLVPPYAEWRYLTAAAPAGWQSPDFDDTAWKTGAAGFGYGDIDAGTALTDMPGNYRGVYLRHEFEVADPARVSAMHLMCNYDDAFIAYLNGTEVLRVGVPEGAAPGAGTVAVHEGDGPPYDYKAHLQQVRANDVYGTELPGVPLYHEYFLIRDPAPRLRAGRNVIAIEGHNASIDSKAFTIDPYLLATVPEEAP